jgi:monoamine oxidase
MRHDRSRATLKTTVPTWWPSPLDGGGRSRTAGARRRRRADVVVVGGGLSGLVAADRLARAGASVVVMEARPTRVGGRLATTDLLGCAADLGGAWVGARHDRTRSLIAELGLETFPTHDRGERVVVRADGRRGRIQRALTARGVNAALRRLDELSRDLPLDDPSSWPRTAAADARGLDSYLPRLARSRQARAVLRDMFVNVLATEPDAVSVFHALWYAQAGGGLAQLVSTTDGAQQDLVAGGAHTIAVRLAERLGDAVELGAAVTAIERGPAGVTAMAGSVAVDAAAALLAVSPALAGRIDVSGLNPPPRPALASGDAVKCVVAYDTAFWRDGGLSGWAWGDALPFSFTHDVSPPGGEPGLLAVFFVGERARRLRSLPAEGRRAHVTGALETAFGPWARHDVAFAMHDWTADPWTLGAYGSSLPPGGWAAVPRPAENAPQSPIVWAGTESATEHHGYMEGAVRAGERAAVRSLQLA